MPENLAHPLTHQLIQETNDVFLQPNTLTAYIQVMLHLHNVPGGLGNPVTGHKG